MYLEYEHLGAVMSIDVYIHHTLGGNRTHNSTVACGPKAKAQKAELIQTELQDHYKENLSPDQICPSTGELTLQRQVGTINPVSNFMPT